MKGKAYAESGKPFSIQKEVEKKFRKKWDKKYE